MCCTIDFVFDATPDIMQGWTGIWQQAWIGNYDFHVFLLATHLFPNITNATTCLFPGR